MKSITTLIATYFLLIFPLWASEDQKGYCQNAQTTGDIVECLSLRHKAENEKMIDLFKMIENLQPKLTDEITINQEQWLLHRNKTCDLQSKAYEGGSLQNVERLSCIAEKTGHRNKTLHNIIMTYDQSHIPEYSNPPRWVNVLVRDYPEIFWGFGSAQDADSDCDGQNENIVRGIDTNQKMILAIADSEKTGRPKVTAIHFDDTKNCQILQDITIERLPEAKPTEEKKLSCKQNINIETKTCGNFTIEYNNDNKTYNLTKQDN